jgi:hypothetical protein
LPAALLFLLSLERRFSKLRFLLRVELVGLWAYKGLFHHVSSKDWSFHLFLGRPVFILPVGL